MALPSSILPSTTAEVLAEQDALKASSSFRRLPAQELPSFLVSLTSKIANEAIDPNKLYSRNLAIRQTYYSHVIKIAKVESSLLILAIKYDKTEKLNSPALRTEYINRLSNLVMGFMGKYNFILKDIPKTDIIANKLGKDVYFHLMKRLPSLIVLINNPDNTESSKAFTDALYYIKSSVMHPLTRFISLLLGELASSGSRPDIDKREFKKEQKADKAALKEDFRKNKKFYKSKWAALRNEASATLSNLEIEASVASNSSKTKDILNERRARIDNFIYSLEQGIQSINNNSFEGFVSAKVAIEDSIIEYSKRLEFRTIARKSREIDEASNLKNKPKDRRTTPKTSSWFTSKPKTKVQGKSGSDRYVHGVLKHLGPAGLALYAGYKLANNKATRFVIGKSLKYLVGKPLKYLGGKAIQGTGFVAKAAGRKFVDSLGYLSRAAFTLAGRGLPIAGAAAIRGISKLGASAGSLSSRVAGKAQSLYSKLPSKKEVARLADRAMYGAGYGAGSAIRGTKSGAGLLSNLLKSTFSPTSLASSTSKVEPDMSGMLDAPTQPKSGFPLSLLQQPIPAQTLTSKKPGFPLELISRSIKLPKLKSGLSSPTAELFIDDILDRIDEHVPYIPADLTEQDFTLDDIKDVVGDALEEFLSGSDPKEPTKLSEVVAQETAPVVSLPPSITTKVEETAEALVELKTDSAQALKVSSVYEAKITDLVKTNHSLQEQLEALDRQLDKLLSQQVRRNPYESGLRTEITRIKDSVLEKTTHIEKLLVNSTKEKVYDRPRTKNLVEGKTDDQLLQEETAAREDRSDRTKLVSAIQKLSRSKSRSSQTGSLNVSGLLSGLLGSSLIGKAITSIESVLGGGAGTIVKSVLPKIIKYAPRLASFAMPAIALAGSAYAGWELGSKLYEKYSTEILDAIDSVINTATTVVQGINDGYEFLTSMLKTPAEKLKEAGTKLSNWWDTNPISRGAEYVSKGASKAAGLISDKANRVGSSVASGVQSVSSSVGSAVDSVTTAASGAKTYVSNSIGKLFSTNRSSVDFDNIDPTVKSNFESMAQEYRASGGSKPLSIESARRSTEQQAKLYAANPSIAAKPGHSLHEQGKALDIDRATAGELESMGLLSKYGFARNVKGEPWHLSYVGAGAVPPSAQQQPSTRTQVQTSPTTAKPSYEMPPTAPAQYTKPSNAQSTAPAAAASSSPINTFSFLDSSFFIMNAGMMAS